MIWKTHSLHFEDYSPWNKHYNSLNILPVVNLKYSKNKEEWKNMHYFKIKLGWLFWAVQYTWMCKAMVNKYNEIEAKIKQDELHETGASDKA